MHKTRNLLHTPHPPNNSILATRSESYCTLLSECCATDSWTTKAKWATGMAQTKA